MTATPPETRSPAHDGDIAACRSDAGMSRRALLAWLGVGAVGAMAGGLGVVATLALSPDLIVLGGDMVDRRAPGDVAPLLEQLGRLRARLDTFAIRGNHECHWRGDLPRLEADLAGLGVPVLVNRGRMVRILGLPPLMPA